MRNLPPSHLKITPAVIADALALVSCPDVAANAPVSLRRLAWMVTATAHGHCLRQLPNAPTGNDRSA